MSLDLDMSRFDVFSRNSHQVGRRPQTFFILSKSTNSCKQASLSWMFCSHNKAFIVCWYLSCWSEVQPPRNPVSQWPKKCCHYDNTRKRIKMICRVKWDPTRCKRKNSLEKNPRVYCPFTDFLRQCPEGER